ncbi:hypothetical protein LTR56_013985 [Elasticomyces elasticus]|nr:hypothetical protein LTR56_013985 [Elasticomyces elasticus]KAK3651780.1 hypothetical protein LTR22_011949 [Elasticomyces elasticus]KAK4902384.1 hypothetical protein LTR49_027092 [Elasticomyces elasticus]KAK5752474.1 hypothetical protein LTS12_017411 [Elasticomyces elasticus]
MIKAANLCVSVAREQIQLVIGKIELQQDDLPAPWYNVFCRGDESQPNRSSNSHRTIDAIREAGNIIRERAPAAPTEQDPDLNFFNETFAPDTIFDESVLDQGWLCNSADMDWLSVAPFLEGLTDEIG